MAESDLAEQLVGVVEPLLGRHTARRILSMVCDKLAKGPEDLEVSDLPAVQEVLRPVLRTLVGRHVASKVLVELGSSIDPTPVVPPTSADEPTTDPSSASSSQATGSRGSVSDSPSSDADDTGSR